MWFEYPLRMTPLLFLFLLICWAEDLCRLRRPRSTNHYAPHQCTIHYKDLCECALQRREQKKTAPLPLPTKRKRALTFPHQLKRWQRIGSQSSCPLLSKLPTELRQIIYTNVLKGSTSTLHIVQKTNFDPSSPTSFPHHQRRLGSSHQRHLGSWACVRSPHKSICNEFHPANWCPQSCSGHIDVWHPWGSEKTPYGNWLPLLLTCRQTYAEGINMLYSSHIFSFSEPRLLNVFASTILPQRLNAIRKLHVEHSLPFWLRNIVIKDVSDCSREEARLWRTFCDTVNKMESLQELLIDVFNLEKSDKRSLPMETRILQPFMTIRPIEDFVVRISWDGLGFSDENAPFRIVRARGIAQEGERESEDEIETDEYNNPLPGNMV